VMLNRPANSKKRINKGGNEKKLQSQEKEGKRVDSFATFPQLREGSAARKRKIWSKKTKKKPTRLGRRRKERKRNLQHWKDLRHSCPERRTIRNRGEKLAVPCAAKEREGVEKSREKKGVF